MIGENGGGEHETERLAPVIPLFGAPRGHGSVPEDEGSPSERHPARGPRRDQGAEREKARPSLRAIRPHARRQVDDVEVDVEVDGHTEVAPSQVREAAEEALVRKLRSRSLSVSEARTVLRGHALTATEVDEVIDDFCHRGYLDDQILASLLVTSGAERKGQGRAALSRALAQRGIPRDVIAAALAELPDDDADRALEYARTKARSLGRLDFETALRRLVGQLSRRGYNGAVAMTAARTALTENASGQSSSTVRFVDSD